MKKNYSSAIIIKLSKDAPKIFEETINKVAAEPLIADTSCRDVFHFGQLCL